MRIFDCKKYLAFILCIIFCVPNQAFSLNELSSFNRQGINFNISEENNNIALKITGAQISEINKFVLNNPARIVVDIVGMKISRSENISINNVPLIAKIRLGAHPPYTTRLVIDLKDNSIPSYTTFLNYGSLTILLANQGGNIENSIANNNMANNMVNNAGNTIDNNVNIAQNQNNNINNNINNITSLSEPNVIRIERLQNNVAVNTPIAVESPAINDISNNQAIEAPQVQITPNIDIVINQTPSLPSAKTQEITNVIPNVETAIVKQEPIKQEQTLNILEGTTNNVTSGQEKLNQETTIQGDSNCVLSAVVFDKDVTNSPIAKILLNKKSNFTVTKVPPELYKIVIPNCKLASKNLELPFFPQPEFKSFIFIQAKQTSNSIEVSIGVEENTALNYLQRDSEIWVKP